MDTIGPDFSVRLVCQPATARWENGQLIVLMAGQLEVSTEFDGPAADSIARTPLATPRLSLLLHSRTSGADWPVGEPDTVHFDQPGDVDAAVAERGSATLRFELNASIDPLRAAMDQPLADEIFDLIVVVATPHQLIRRRVPFRRGRELPALVSGRPAVAYRTNPGDLALDLSADARRLVEVAGITLAASSVNPRPDGTRDMRLALTDVHVSGTGRYPAALILSAELPADLHTHGTQAELRFRPDPPAQWSVSTVVQKRTSGSGLVLSTGGAEWAIHAAHSEAPQPILRPPDPFPGSGQPPSGVKITVIMATYNTGSVLARTVASLDAQSLSPAEFEVIIIDDGSTDDTYARLVELCAARPNFRTDRIPNSGWPGRPRNLAATMATGEYVLYMDHDDELFPEALERMYAYAAGNDADVLLAKEVKTGGVSTGWETWRHNQPRVPRVDQAVLQCMTPHKLYRRSLIESVPLRYMEGRVRLECYHFNAQAYAHAKTISILADYPCYRWILHQSNSHQASIDLDVYWQSFHDSLTPIIAGDIDPDVRAEVQVRWYSRIVLGRLRGGDSTMKAWIQDHADWILEHFPESIDERLEPTFRLLSHLYRQRDWAALEGLRSIERGIGLQTDESSVNWVNGSLHVSARGRLVYARGPAYPVEVAGEQILRALPGVNPREPIPDEVLDVGANLTASRVEVSVRAKTGGTEWPIPSEGSLWVETNGSDPVIAFEVTGTIAPPTAALGGALDADLWDVALRSNVLGYEIQSPMPAEGMTEQPAVVGGIVSVAYASPSGQLALDLNGSARTVIGAARVNPEDITFSGNDGVVALPRVHAVGAALIAGTAVLDYHVPAELTAEGQSAFVTAQLPAALERCRLSFRFGKNKSARRLDLVLAEAEAPQVVFENDPVDFKPVAPSADAEATPSSTALLSRVSATLKKVRKGAGGLR